MAKLKKHVSIRSLNESAVRATIKTMSIEGRRPDHAPKVNTASPRVVVLNLKSSSRDLIG